MTMLLYPKKEDAQSHAAIDAASAPVANAHSTVALKNGVAALKLNADLNATVVADVSLAVETANARVRVDLGANPGRAADGSVAPGMKDVVVEMTVNVVVRGLVEVMRGVKEAAIRWIRPVETPRGGDRTVLLIRLERMKSGCIDSLGMATDRGRHCLSCSNLGALHGVEAFTIPRAPKGLESEAKDWEH